jgi:hypothetical protein
VGIKRIRPKRPLLITALMLFIAIAFGLLTLIFIYVRSDAKKWNPSAMIAAKEQIAKRRVNQISTIQET